MRDNYDIQLSEREERILDELPVGALDKQIAGKLDIAQSTVKADIKAILRKLRVDNRTQAANWAWHRNQHRKKQKLN